jgi:hypothetical protein
MTTPKLNPMHGRQWTKAELNEKWRHQKRLRSRPAAVGPLVICAGLRSIQLEAFGPRSVDLELDASATAIVAYSKALPASDPVASELVGIHLLWWDDEGRLTDTSPARYRLKGGRSLIFHPPLARPGEPSCSVRVELRDGVARRLIGLAAQRFAGALAPDFCLAELRTADLRSWPIWQSLLCSFALVPSFVAVAVALVLALAGSPPSAFFFGITVGALVAFIGTLVCGATVSVVGASLGGIPISILLGVTNGLLVRSAGGLEQAADRLRNVAPVVPGLGGLVALIRPPVSAVILISGSIGLLSVAMGAVRRLRGVGTERDWNLKGLVQAVVLSSMGPGLIAGIGTLGARMGFGEWSFGVGLAFTGGIAFGASIALRSGRRRGALLFGLGYAALVLLSVMMGPRLALGVAYRLMLATTAHHIVLQGTFFALAYTLGERSSGPRGGALASSVEGIAGYTGFLLSRYGLF